MRSAEVFNKSNEVLFSSKNRDIDTKLHMSLNISINLSKYPNNTNNIHCQQKIKQCHLSLLLTESRLSRHTSACDQSR